MPKEKKSKKRRTNPVAAPKTKWRTRTKTITKWRNRAKKRASRMIRGPVTKMDMRTMLRDGCALAGGMVIAKVCVNKLTAGGHEDEKWSWPNIAMAAGSGVAGAMLLGVLFKLKKPTVKMIALGGVGLAVYKTVTTKVAPTWAWSADWFGEDDDELLGLDADDEFEVVDYDPDDMGYVDGPLRRFGSRFVRNMPISRAIRRIRRPHRRHPGRRPPQHALPPYGRRPPQHALPPYGRRPPQSYGRRRPPQYMPQSYRRPPYGFYGDDTPDNRPPMQPPPGRMPPPGMQPPPGRMPPPPRGRRPVPMFGPKRRPPFGMFGGDDDMGFGYSNTGGQIVPVNPVFGDDDDDMGFGYSNTGGQVVPVNPVFGDFEEQY